MGLAPGTRERSPFSRPPLVFGPRPCVVRARRLGALDPLRRGAVFFLLGVAIGCERGTGDLEDPAPAEAGESRVASVVALRGEVLSNAAAIGIPSEIRWTTGHLWVSDVAHDPAIHLLDDETGTLRMSLGRRGDGPGEFQSVPHLVLDPRDGSGAMWGWDRDLGRLTLLEPSVPVRSPRVLRVAPSAADSVVGGVRVPWRVIWLDDGVLVGVNASEENRFSFISLDGTIVRSVAGPLLGTEAATPTQRVRATMSGFMTCGWPTRGFVILYKFLGRVEFYDLEGRFVRAAEVPSPSDGFVTGPSGTPVADFSESHYQSCTVRGDRLFAGYAGRVYDDFEPGDPSSYAVGHIHVFGWDGRLERQYHLDRPVFAIDIDSEGNNLYATSLVTSAIYRFPLTP